VRRVFRALARLLLRLAGDGGNGAVGFDRPGAGRLDQERTGVGRSLQERGGSRQRERHVLGAPASEDGVAWDDETVYYWDGDTRVTLREHRIRVCDCGALIASYAASAKGVCTKCGRLVCTVCERYCDRCGAALCPDHSVRSGQHTFCSRHAWLIPWLWFAGNWRVSVPGSVCGGLAYFIANSVRQPEDPWWTALAVGLFVGLGAGAAGKAFLDDVFGGERRP